MLQTVSQGLVDLPNLEELQLDTLGQRDFLVKILTFIQVNYLVIQLICRKVGGLPSTQLEITALAFAVCSTITYALYWNRPQGVKATRIIKAKKFVTGSELQYLVRSIVGSGPTYIWTGRRFRPSIIDPKSMIGPQPIPNDSNTAIKSTGNWIEDVTGGNPELGAVIFGALAGGTIFGGLHCPAWNFHFPTHGELVGWRICSVGTTVLPIFSIIPAIMWLYLNPSNGLKALEDHSKLLRGRVQLEQLEQVLRGMSERIKQLEKPLKEMIKLLELSMQEVPELTDKFRIPDAQELLKLLDRIVQLWLQGQPERFKQLEQLEAGIRYSLLLQKRFRQEKRVGKFEQEKRVEKLKQGEQEWFEQLKLLNRLKGLVQFVQRAQASKGNIESMWINSIGRSWPQNSLSREEGQDPLTRDADIRQGRGQVLSEAVPVD